MTDNPIEMEGVPGGDETGKEKNFVSIIILTCNNLDYNKLCIESVRQHTKAGSYEIIVVDNASADGTVDWLKQQPDITLIANPENLGFSKGCNQGYAASRGDLILFLNNDTIVTENWLDNLVSCVKSSPDIGAAGPMTNMCSYYQRVHYPFTSLEALEQFAHAYNTSDPKKWEGVIKLIGFCLLVKREVLEKTGGAFDERFSPANFEDDDLSMRILQAGYRLMMCKDTFIHHFGSKSFTGDHQRFNRLMQENRKKFVEKWGFDPSYSFYKRLELAGHLKKEKSEPIRVLEVGCACGATLLYIKHLYPHAELYGIELNERAAAIAGTFAHVISGDCERDGVDFEEGFFDYIIMGDVLEHLKDPWSFVAKCKTFLKDGGYAISSIPNIMHYSVIAGLLSGRWIYTDSGLLDRTHLRFFTPMEAFLLFTDTGYRNIENAFVVSQTKEGLDFIDRLCALKEATAHQAFFRVYQILVIAQK